MSRRCACADHDCAVHEGRCCRRSAVRELLSGVWLCAACDAARADETARLVAADVARDAEEEGR